MDPNRSPLGVWEERGVYGSRHAFDSPTGHAGSDESRFPIHLGRDKEALTSDPRTNPNTKKVSKRHLIRVGRSWQAGMADLSVARPALPYPLSGFPLRERARRGVMGASFPLGAWGRGGSTLDGTLGDGRRSPASEVEVGGGGGCIGSPTPAWRGTDETQFGRSDLGFVN